MTADQRSITDYQLYRLLGWNHNPREYEKRKRKHYDWAHYDDMLGGQPKTAVLPQESVTRPPPYSQVTEGEASGSGAETPDDAKPGKE